MSDELSQKQEKAAELHASGASKAEACRQAGYSETTATKAQSRVFNKPPMLEAVARFREELFKQLRRKGMTPERIAETLARKLDYGPDALAAIALWVKIVAPNERAQLQMEVNESVYELLSIAGEELKKATEKLPKENCWDFKKNMDARLREWEKVWAKRLRV